MIYAVFGPREVRGELFTDEKRVSEALSSIKDLTGLILGGGKGAETFAENWAKEHNLPFTHVTPNIKAYGTRKAFDLRNTEMINRAEGVVVFWDGAARSTHELLSRIILMQKYAKLFPV
jgi:hypothetical protein